MLGLCPLLDPIFLFGHSCIFLVMVSMESWVKPCLSWYILSGIYDDECTNIATSGRRVLGVTD